MSQGRWRATDYHVKGVVEMWGFQAGYGAASPLPLRSCFKNSQRYCSRECLASELWLLIWSLWDVEAWGRGVGWGMRSKINSDLSVA